MTGNELRMLKEWQDERHTEIKAHLVKIDGRLDRIESLPLLKAAGLMEKLTTRRVVVATAVPGTGGVLYLIDRLKGFLT